MWKLIAVPIVGAIIGYATNWIAVKMLFRPRHAVHFLGWKLPFTPGVIPKGQGRLARAVGRAVEEQLLTKEVLSKVLLSDEMIIKVREAAADWVKSGEESCVNLRDAAARLLTEEKTQNLIDGMEEQITDMVCEKITEMNPGRLVADKVLEAAREKLEESMFGMMLGSSFLEPIAKLVEERINEYLKEHGRDYVEEAIGNESEKLQNKTVGELFILLGEKDVDIPSLAVFAYEKLITKKLQKILGALHIAAIVEDRINAMEVVEVEELLLSIMKKELGAIVNLGALIGFILGLINVAILCI